MHFVIYGPEGSGKGTQAKLLAQALSLPVYTSGDLVREAATADTKDIGNVCREALNSGKYVPDKQMFILWDKKLAGSEARKGFISDGFPRNIKQAKFFLRKAKEYGYNIDKVIYLKLTDEEAYIRLAKRNRKLFEGSAVSHDTPERISKRLEIYRVNEKEAVKFFRQKKMLLEINGNGTIDEVFNKIKVELKICP